MSDANPPAGLQFERAEFTGEPAAAACASCGTAIRSTYYQVGSAITCERCRRQIEFDATQGSPLGRFAKATLFGLVAAGLGAGLYYAISAITGYEFGLIAVVVGVAVGAAVRAGSGHRGGVPYQLLAMFLTYTAIVSTYVPGIVKQLGEHSEAETATPAAATPSAPRAAPAPARPGVPYPPPLASPAPEPSFLHGLPAPLRLLVALAAVVAFFLAVPFLGGFQNAIGVIIIAIGLYEAWKINRKADRTVTGPFRIEAAPAAPPTS
jgi:hypothetical protein